MRGWAEWSSVEDIRQKRHELELSSSQNIKKQKVDKKEKESDANEDGAKEQRKGQEKQMSAAQVKRLDKVISKCTSQDLKATQTLLLA